MRILLAVQGIRSAREGTVNPLLLLSLGALIVSTASSVTPIPAVDPPNPTSAPLGLDGGCGPQDSGPWLWNCVFLGSVWDPTLVFFRWDFNGDGIWDFPWTTDLVVGHRSSDIGVIRVILQGWDGVSTLNGEPTGPVAGKDLVLGNALEFGPAAWNRSSSGWMSAVWEYPRGFQPPGGRPAKALVYSSLGSTGVPAIPLPRSPHTRLEPVGVAFRVDQALLTQVLGSGTHRVWIWGQWGSYEFASLLTDVSLP